MLLRASWATGTLMANALELVIPVRIQRVGFGRGLVVVRNRTARAHERCCTELECQEWGALEPSGHPEGCLVVLL